MVFNNRHQEVGGGVAQAEVKKTDRVLRVGAERTALEKNVLILSPEVAKRIELDLSQNGTADYRRINLTEVYACFDFKIAPTITHWRIAKILDGISICADEFKITNPISAKDIPKKIYQVIEAGKGDDKNWPLKIKNPETGVVESIKASLADFSHFIDVLELNKQLVTNRISTDVLVYNYFFGRKLKTEIETKEGKKKELDLLDEVINPRDNLDNIDIAGYKKQIKSSQVGFQMLGDWRWESEGFRVLGGHACSVELDDVIQWIPTGGRMAAQLTMTDLEKKEKSGMDGQPQEVGEMDEVSTGAIVRFRLADLAQRRKGGDIRSVNKTKRLAKAMVGLTLQEDAINIVKTEKDKKIIYLCGSKLDGNIITGIKTHYDKLLMKTRGRELSKEEAADIAMTDVFIPCILNNENDWLTALPTVFSVGGSKGAQSLLQNKDNFPDFVIKITCFNPDTKKIEEQSFTGMKQLRLYIVKRIQLGHIDQPGANHFASESAILANGKTVGPENEFFLQAETDENGGVIKEALSKTRGKQIGAMLKELLGDYAEEYIAAYIKTPSALLDSIRDEQGNLFKKGEPAVGKTKMTVDQIIRRELEEAVIKDKNGKVVEMVEKIYDIDIDREDIDTEVLVSGIVLTLRNLPESDRKKLINYD